jgi:deoxyribodipyrimidine photo-lyase
VQTALWWIRRDLRLGDNQALSAAFEQADQVVPVFVLDPVLLDSDDVGPKRVAFLFDGLRKLDAELRARDSRLVVRRGSPADELTALAAQTGAGAVFAEEDFSPYARQRDAEVTFRLRGYRSRLGGRAPGNDRTSLLHLIGRPTVQAPDAVLKRDGTPYVVFTYFNHRWKTLPPPTADGLVPAPKHMCPHGVSVSVPIPEEPRLPDGAPFPPGEGEAQRRLTAFTEGREAPIYRYADTRDRIDLPTGTSMLSPYLRFGMLSARQAVTATLAAIERAPTEVARKSATTWLDELIWREFYVSILYHFPSVLHQSFRSEYRQIDWQNDQAAFESWRSGHTGFPVVDAAMRQLTQTGWMHNRARMITASFLVKDLLIDWRWGERHFMQHLVDGDPAANNGGWQWSAGTGTDAVPYFRVFNPVTQGQRFDPHGTFVRQWIPELRRVPDRTIHEPWKMDRASQRAAGCIIGQDYPLPIVDHARARQRTLSAYRAARETG